MGPTGNGFIIHVCHETMPNWHSYVHTSEFSLGRLHMEGGGASEGDKSLMGDS